jgi:hypothetical protein
MDKPHCAEHSGCITQIETNKVNIKTLFDTCEKIKNRPPVWMSLSFTVAVGVIGWLMRGL